MAQPLGSGCWAAVGDPVARVIAKSAASDGELVKCLLAALLRLEDSFGGGCALSVGLSVLGRTLAVLDQQAIQAAGTQGWRLYDPCYWRDALKAHPTPWFWLYNFVSSPCGHDASSPSPGPGHGKGNKTLG